MPIQRRISWNAALRDMRSDRAPIASGLVSARSLIQALARHRRTRFVTPAGAFDRSAIMAAAVEAAKAHQGRTGTAWGPSMSIALKAAWQAARAARSAIAH